MKSKLLFSLVSLLLSLPAWAISLKAGEWTIDIDGNVNVYYTQMTCSGTLVTPIHPATDTPQGVASLIACDNYNHAQSANISNGFLPNALTIAIESNKDKLRIGAVIGLYFSSGNNDRFRSGRTSFNSNKNIDIRQAYLLFGSSEGGTFKLGRDYRLFGFNAMIAAANTVSVGLPSGRYSAQRMALGNVGAGTVYPGVTNSFSYTSPTINGFSGTVAISSPVSPQEDRGIYYRKLPALSAQLNYTNPTLHLWSTLTRQEFSTDNHIKTVGVAYEVGASYAVGHGLSLMANYQGGAGLGLIELFDNIVYDPLTQHIDKDHINNFLVGASYRRGQVKIAYTIGRTSCHASEHSSHTSTLNNNTNQTLGIYYSVTTNLTISAEYDLFKTRNFDTNATGKAKAFSIGAAFIF